MCFCQCVFCIERDMKHPPGCSSLLYKWLMDIKSELDLQLIGTLVLKHYQAKKNGPLMGQVFLDLSDHGGGGMGWQNLRKWEKN